MFGKSNILIHLIFFITQESTFGEWVEIPQFSDKEKVYRIPFTKYERGQKYFLNNNPNGQKLYGYENASSIVETFHRPFNQYDDVDKTTKSILSTFDNTGIVSTTESLYFTDKSEYTITEKLMNNEHQTKDPLIEDEDEDIITVSTIHLDDKIIMDGDQPYQAIPDNDDSHGQTVENETEDNVERTSFLAFVPIELFKKVHAILKSQSSNGEGKMDFLRRFEKTLMAEIEKRLVPVISPTRKKRESRGDHGWSDHGWDDHNDSVGFPSLEGALMAISFLTFAVYLVQLVMMLFRSLGNNSNVTGTPTVVFPRNKRFIDDFTEDTARILNYLDNFAMKSKL